MRDRGDAERRRVAQRARRGRVAHVGRGVGNGAVDQAERLILEDARGLTAPVAQNLPAERRGRVLGDLRGAHRRGVGERFVAVEPVDEDGIVGRDGVDPLVTGQRLPFP